jgi:hypothetical protein
MSQAGTLTLARMLRPYVAYGDSLDEIIDFVSGRKRTRPPARKTAR